MENVTDPKLLARLNSSEGKEVKNPYKDVQDPELLARLNAPEEKPSLGMRALNTAENAAGGITNFALGAGDSLRNAMLSALTNQTPGEQAINQLAPANRRPSILPAPSGSGGAYDIGRGTGQMAASLAPAIVGGIGMGATKIPALAGEATENALVKMFRGTLSPEKLKQNLDLYEGIPTHLGNVLESPFIKKNYENLLAHLPFSGGPENLQRTANAIKGRGEDILDNLLGEQNKENIPATINNALTKTFKEHQKFKRDIYEAVDDVADKEDLRLNLPKFSKTADKFSKALEDQEILKYEPHTASLISKLRNYKTPNVTEKSAILDASGNPIVKTVKNEHDVNLKEANLLKGYLRNLSNKYGQSPNPVDRQKAGFFGELSSALKSDINQSIEDHLQENPDSLVKQGYKLAERNYRQNFSPFLDNEIYKFAHGNADPDTIVNAFLKTGKTQDRANLLEKLSSKLPPSKRNLLGYHYLSRAIDQGGDINPNKLNTLISRNSIGPRQFEVLFPDERVRNALLNFSKITEGNQKALRVLENPPTGQQGLELLMSLALKGGKGVLGAGAKLAGGRKLVNALTNEKTRTRFVNKILEKEKAKK